MRSPSRCARRGGWPGPSRSETQLNRGGPPNTGASVTRFRGRGLALSASHRSAVTYPLGHVLACASTPVASGLLGVCGGCCRVPRSLACDVEPQRLGCRWVAQILVRFPRPRHGVLVGLERRLVQQRLDLRRDRNHAESVAPGVRTDRRHVLRHARVRHAAARGIGATLVLRRCTRRSRVVVSQASKKTRRPGEPVRMLRLRVFTGRTSNLPRCSGSLSGMRADMGGGVAVCGRPRESRRCAMCQEKRSPIG